MTRPPPEMIFTPLESNYEKEITMERFKRIIAAAIKKSEKILFERKELFIEGEHTENMDQLLADMYIAGQALHDDLHDSLDADTALEMMVATGEAIAAVEKVVKAVAILYGVYYDQLRPYATIRLTRIVGYADEIRRDLDGIQMKLNLDAMRENRQWY